MISVMTFLLNVLCESHVTDADANGSLILSVALLQLHLLRVRAAHVSTATVSAAGRGLVKKGRGLGFHHLVEVREIRHVFARRRERHDGGELVAPQDLVGQVGGAHLTGG